MPTPYTNLTTSALNTMCSSTLGSLKPSQIRQVFDYLSRVGESVFASAVDISTESTISTIATAMGSENP